jgi:hypothetical protein
MGRRLRFVPGVSYQGPATHPSRFVPDTHLLFQYARLINFSNPLWATSWTNAVESSITYLLKQSTGGQWFLNAYNSGTLSYSTGDLACFAGSCLLFSPFRALKPG